MNSDIYVSAIVPVRNEESTIARAVRSLAEQPEVTEILVVNDQSADRTVERLQQLAAVEAKLRWFDAGPLPPGWVGKNHAAWCGARQARGRWLLFTDADVVHLPGSAARAVAIAEARGVEIFSCSPRQETVTWWERALIPFVYGRLSRLYPYAEVNDPDSPSAAANGQYLLIRRDAYRKIGGHAAVSGEVLEDVALARRAKSVGVALRFVADDQLARVRMYASFGAMWEGWTKNLFPLVTVPGRTVGRELLSAVPWISLLCFALLPLHAAFGVLGGLLLAGRHVCYARTLRRNRFPLSSVVYYAVAFPLYCAALLVSGWRYACGKVRWRGREYTAERREPKFGRNSGCRRDIRRMIYLTRKIEFSASHLYHNPDLSAEENRRLFGKCNNPNGHGHNYVLEVTVGGETDPATGMVLDLKQLKEILEGEVMERMDHRFLNYEVPELAGQIPTCENLAALIWRLVEPKIVRGRLHRIRLWESPDLYVDCFGNGWGR